MGPPRGGKRRPGTFRNRSAPQLGFRVSGHMLENLGTGMVHKGKIR